MKVANSEGREYYVQPSKDNLLPRWCSTVEPTRIDLDGTVVEVFADRERSNYIYLIFEGTTYCVWAKDPRNFDFLEETSLRITDRGRARSKARRAESSQPRTTGRSPKFQMGEEDEPPTREDLDAVLWHLPRLREQVEARAADPEAADGLYPAKFSAAVRKVVEALFQHRFMFPFNYQPWMDEARKLEEDRELLSKADLETLRKLVVVHWRRDYWDYDHTHWESIAASGHLVAILDRLQEIAETTDPAPTDDEQSQPSHEEMTEEEAFGEITGSSKSDFVPPPVEQYVRALSSIREKISPRQMTMLEAHYYSPRHSATMHELAAAAEYSDYRAANAQYGRLARILLQEMGLPAPIWRGFGPVWVLGIGDLIEDGLVMHSALANALEQLGWVVARSEPAVDDFVAAFERLSGRITREHAAMLVLTYAARERGVTLWELTQVCGHEPRDPKHGWISFQGLAGMVYSELGYSKPAFDALKQSFWDLVLARAEPSNGEMCGNYGVVIKLRPSVAEALERLRIVDNIESPSLDGPTNFLGGEWHTAYEIEPDTDGTLSPVREISTEPRHANAPMTLTEVGIVARWHGELRDSISQERVLKNEEDSETLTSMLEGTVKKMLTEFEAIGVFVEVDLSEIRPIGDRYAANPDELTEADLMTLRKLLSYYLIKSGRPINHIGFFYEDDGYWSGLALNGPLLRILRIFGQIYRDVSAKTLVQ